MSDNKIRWWLIIAVVIVVAVVASLVTVNLTGNVIKLNQDTYGRYKVYTTTEVDAKIASIRPLSGTYYGCYKKGGSTIEWGSNLYTNNSQILTNSVDVKCNPGEDALLSDFTCNPRYWQQRTPVYVSGVSMFSRPIGNLTANGRTLTCTGGESQGIMNIWCCKKS